MSLSKKDIDKLKSISINSSKIKKSKVDIKSNQSNSDNPNEMFYSIIDNSNDLEETLLINKRLKKTEDDFLTSNKYKYQSNKNKKEKTNTIALSEEDLLYDEFNYLLDE